MLRLRNTRTTLDRAALRATHKSFCLSWTIAPKYCRCQDEGDTLDIRSYPYMHEKCGREVKTTTLALYRKHSEHCPGRQRKD